MYYASSFGNNKEFKTRSQLRKFISYLPLPQSCRLLGFCRGDKIRIKFWPILFTGAHII